MPAVCSDASLHSPHVCSHPSLACVQYALAQHGRVSWDDRKQAFEEYALELMEWQMNYGCAHASCLPCLAKSTNLTAPHQHQQACWAASH
jgi:hypothetical protein